MSDAQDREAVLGKLAAFAQIDVEPTLTYQELEDILDECARGVRWATVTDLGIGTTVLPTVYNGHIYQVVTAGTTAVAEPTWPESGTVMSGDVEFEEVGFYFYSSLYNLREAKRKVAELKESKSSDLISSPDSGNERVIHDYWVEAERKHSTPMIA